jgi:hypothetical protein
VTDQFDLGMLASLTVGIMLTEITLDEVCHRIEEAEREQHLGLHGGWADAVNNRSAVKLTSNGPILLLAYLVETDRGTDMKWVQVEVTDQVRPKRTRANPLGRPQCRPMLGHRSFGEDGH